MISEEPGVASENPNSKSNLATTAIDSSTFLFYLNTQSLDDLKMYDLQDFIRFLDPSNSTHDLKADRFGLF